MQNIDPYLGADLSQSLPRFGQNSGQPYQQAWQRAMEEAGLKKTMDGIQAFKLTSWQAGNGADSDGVAREPKEHPAMTATADSMSGRSARAGQSARDVARALRQSLLLPQAARSREIAPIPGAQAEAPIRVRLPAPVGESLPIGRRNVTDHVERWEAQHISILRNASGDAEVWIRDAALDSPKAVAVLGILKNTMGRLGASLVRVSLNGKEVFARDVTTARVPNIRGG